MQPPLQLVQKSRSRFVLATLISLIMGSFSLGLFATPSLADSNSETDGEESGFTTPIIYESVQDLFQKAITYESGNFFTNRSQEAQLQLILGVGESERSGFPENELTRDTNLVHILYKDYLRQQAGGEPIRTRDLENPYDRSLSSPNAQN